MFSNLSMDTLDYTGPAVNEGSKGVWLGLGDPVRDLPRQFTRPTLPPGVTRRARVLRRLPGGRRAGATRDEPGAAGAAGRAIRRLPDWPLVVVTDEPRARRAATMNFLWTTFTRFEPAADIHAADRAHRPQPHRLPRPDRHRRAAEAGFPKELSCDEDTAALVTRRWKEYFPSGAVEMGDSERGHLD